MDHLTKKDFEMAEQHGSKAESLDEQHRAAAVASALADNTDGIKRRTRLNSNKRVVRGVEEVGGAVARVDRTGSTEFAPERNPMWTGNETSDEGPDTCMHEGGEEKPIAEDRKQRFNSLVRERVSSGLQLHGAVSEADQVGDSDGDASDERVGAPEGGGVGEEGAEKNTADDGGEEKTNETTASTLVPHRDEDQIIIEL